MLVRFAATVLMATILLVGGPVAPSTAQDDVYTVSDVVVEGTGDTAYDAQVAAVRGALRQAFARLLDRLGADGIDPNEVSDSRIAGVVDGILARDEQSGDRSYTASITVAFDRTDVDGLIDQLRPDEEVPVAASPPPETPRPQTPAAETPSEPSVVAEPELAPSPSPAPRTAVLAPSTPNPPEPLPTVGITGPVGAGTMLVLPVFVDQGGARLWDAPNPWLQAWQDFDGTGGAARIVVPFGGLADVTSITVASALIGDQLALQRILDRYRADQALVAVAQTTGSGLDIDLRRIDPGAAALTDRLGVGAAGPDLYRIAVADVAVWLDGNAGAIPVSSLALGPGEPSDVTGVAASVDQGAADAFYVGGGPVARPAGRGILVLVPIQSPADWFGMRQRMGQASGVEAVQLVSLSRAEAIVRLFSSNGPSGVAAALAAAGLPTSPIEGGLQLRR